MTQNQISYNSLLETRRHNYVQEGQLIRQTDENIRHNKVVEDISNRDLLEKQRHNLAAENLQGQQISATYYAADRNYEASVYGAQLALSGVQYRARTGVLQSLVSAGASVKNTNATNQTRLATTKATNSTALGNTIISSAANVAASIIGLGKGGRK